MNTNRSRPQLHSVQHDVVSQRTHRAGVRSKPPCLQIVFMRRSERMVRKRPALRLLVPLEERKISDPKKFVIVAVTFLLEQLMPVRHTSAQSPNAPLRPPQTPAVRGSKAHPDHAVRLSPRPYSPPQPAQTNRPQRHPARLAHLRHRSGKHLFQPLEIVEDLGPLLRQLRRIQQSKIVSLFARKLAYRGNMHSNHRQRRIHAERFQITCSKDLANLTQLRQTQIRLIDAVTSNRLIEGHPRKRREDCRSGHGECRIEKALNHGKNRLLLRKRNLQIDLRELRLTVGAQVLIAEAAHDLEIPVAPRDHQYLLEQLRRLRQRIKAPCMDPARNQIIPRALGS